jgi:hypothetical protein
MSRTAITFRVGQRVVCVDASPNQRYGVALPMLKRGGIYVIRAIDLKVNWQAPGWGVHLEGITIIHPDAGCEWAMKPSRFRPVVDRPTDLEVFRKLLAVAGGPDAGAPPSEPKEKKPTRPVQLRLPPRSPTRQE